MLFPTQATLKHSPEDWAEAEKDRKRRASKTSTAGMQSFRNFVQFIVSVASHVIGERKVNTKLTL